MSIGDWDVQVIKEVETPNQPGNPKAGSQRIVDYSFTYSPLGYTIPKKIVYLKFHNDDQILEFLTNQTVVMKSAYIDPLINDMVRMEADAAKLETVNQ